MPLVEPIEIEGLREFMRSLRDMDRALPRALRVAGNEAASIVVDDARGRVPRRSGKAAQSVKAKSTRTAVRITSGGKRAPYFPWLDYGGKVGPAGSVKRKWEPDGRYVYPAFRDNRSAVDATYRKALARLAEESGLTVG